MHILMTGAAGMIGRKLTARLIANKELNGKPIERLTLLDVSAPERPENFSAHVTTLAADLAEPATARASVAGRPDVIFHLAAIVSGEAELDFEKGMHVNFDGSRALLEAIRAIGDGYHPRKVFSALGVTKRHHLASALIDGTEVAARSESSRTRRRNGAGSET